MHYNAITSTTNNNAKGCTSNIASLMSPGSITPGSNTGSLLTPTTANANNSFESRFKDLSIGNIGGGGGGVNGVNTTTAAAANATISNASEVSDRCWSVFSDFSLNNILLCSRMMAGGKKRPPMEGYTFTMYSQMKPHGL